MFIVIEWNYINKLKQLQAKVNCHAITTLQEFIDYNNLSVVGILTVISIITILPVLYFCVIILNVILFI